MTTITTNTLLSKKNLSNLEFLGLKILSSLLKVAKSMKFVLAAGTAITYAFLFTWKFALLFMLGVGLHEMGHI